MMKLGFFLYGTGHHIASWRDPGVMPNANQSLKHYVNITQISERGLCAWMKMHFWLLNGKPGTNPAP